MMDVVYIYKRQGDGDELRYSLRSLQNVSHNTVYIAGESQKWLNNVTLIHNKLYAHSKRHHALQNLLLALDQPELSKDFILMHDDIYIMKPIEEPLFYKRGSFKDTMDEFRSIVGISNYYLRCQANENYLRKYLKIKYPVSYHLHIPMVFNKKLLKESIEATFKDCYGWWEQQYQSIYFNRYGIHSEETIVDPKVRLNVKWDEESVYLSSGDETFSEVKPLLEKRFPKKSIYELD